MKQSQPDIEQIVIDLLHTKMGIAKQRITLQAHLLHELGLDSLDAVELMVEVEKHFAITISDEELEDFVTLQDLVACIETKLSLNEKIYLNYLLGVILACALIFSFYYRAHKILTLL